VKNYYRGDIFKNLFLMSWVYEIFVEVFGIIDTYENNGNHVLKFMICGQQVLTFISTN
jgi:hypothetical protein